MRHESLRAAGGETYRYDGLGRRALQSSAEGLIYSMYSQDGKPLWVRDERISKRRHSIYLQGTLIAERLRPIGADDETVKYQHTDLLGSPVAVTNTGTNPATLNTFQFEPYGRMIYDTNDDTVGYTGHVMDKSTGLVYMQQRYYDATIGRFLSMDPVTTRVGPVSHFNRYVYAFSNPYTFSDPDGRDGRRAANLAMGIMLNDEDFETWRAAEAASPGGSAAVGAADAGRGLREGVSALNEGASIASAASLASARLGGGRRRGASDSGTAPSRSAAKAQVGDKVETPDSNPEKFVRLRGGQGERNNETGETWQRSNTNHSGDSVGEFKVGVDGKPPTPSRKITVTRSNCEVSKRDGC